MSDESDRAPGRLDLIRVLVNTLDFPAGPDELGTLEGAAAWCAAHGLPSPANHEDAARLRAFREALREALFANNGEGDAAAAWRDLEPFARDAVSRYRMDPQRGPLLEPASGGTAGAAALILGLIDEAICRDQWTRLRACRKDTCKMAYYDRSKNGKRAWCSMAVCGNREKAQRRRSRERGGAG